MTPMQWVRPVYRDQSDHWGQRAKQHGGLQFMMCQTKDTTETFGLQTLKIVLFHTPTCKYLTSAHTFWTDYLYHSCGNKSLQFGLVNLFSAKSQQKPSRQGKVLHPPLVAAVPFNLVFKNVTKGWKLLSTLTVCPPPLVILLWSQC